MNCRHAPRMTAAIAALMMAHGAVVPSAAAQDAFAAGAVPSDITSLGPTFAAAAGVYGRYGIAPELVTIEGGSRGLQVLLSGKLQAMHVGFSVIVNANQQGADVRMITASSNVMPMQIFVVPSVKSPADLKGQKIAISAFTSETDMAVSLALRKWGMTRSEVAVTPLGGAAQRMAAQLSGQVPASPYVSPGTATALEKGLVMMLDLGSGGAPWVFNGLVVNSGLLKSNHDLLKRFVKANVEGVYRALTDEAWARGVIAKEFKTDNKAIIDDTYGLLKKVYPRDFTPAPEAVANVIAEVKNMGAALTSTKPADYVDTSIVDALKKEGFFEAMKKQYRL